MAKIKKVVDKDQLASIVASLENSRTFTNQNELFNVIAQTEWAKSIGITASVVYLRVNEYKIPLKTPKGRKGSGKGLADWRASGGQAGKPRKRCPRLSHPKTFEILQKSVPTKLLPLLSKAANGSLKATIKLYCLRCCGYERIEVKNCTAVGCLWHPYRPFQTAKNETEMNQEINDAVVSIEEEGD